jgi:IS30 family transposase
MRCKIEAKLRQERWSPEQISGWLSEQGIKLSHERIYQMIWDDKRDGGNLWRSLRRRGKRYNKRAGKNAGRGLIPNRIDISERPAIVARKTRLGDWEGDTVVSAAQKLQPDESAIVILFENVWERRFKETAATRRGLGPSTGRQHGRR